MTDICSLARRKIFFPKSTLFVTEPPLIGVSLALGNRIGI